MNDLTDRPQLTAVPPIRAGAPHGLAPGSDLEWWTEHEEVAATMHLLGRAGTLPEDQIADFLEKPWHWDRERTIARRLESFMADCGVTSSRGWEMTMLDLAEAGVKREARARTA